MLHRQLSQVTPFSDLPSLICVQEQSHDEILNTDHFQVGRRASIDLSSTAPNLMGRSVATGRESPSMDEETLARVVKIKPAGVPSLRQIRKTKETRPRSPYGGKSRMVRKTMDRGYEAKSIEVRDTGVQHGTPRLEELQSSSNGVDGSKRQVDEGEVKMRKKLMPKTRRSQLLKSRPERGERVRGRACINCSCDVFTNFFNKTSDTTRYHRRRDGGHDG